MKPSATQYIHQGNALAAQGQLDEAIFCFCQAIQLAPACGRAYNNLGVLLRQQQKLQEAESCFLRVLELEPQDTVAYNNLALTYLDMERLADAHYCLMQALELNPDQAETHQHLGLVHEALENFSLAEEAYHQALQIRPHYRDAYFNLGTLLKKQNRNAEASQLLEKALGLAPQEEDTLFALATLRLLEGNYKEGWLLYEQSRRRSLRRLAGKFPLWQGEDLAGRRLLLRFEQGLGDTLQFLRYVPHLQQYASQIGLWLQPSLAPLAASSFPDIPLYTKAPPPTCSYDFICSLLSLPYWLDICPETDLVTPPYLSPSPDRLEHWGQLLSAKAGNKRTIGIVWAGNPKHPNDCNRSLSFDHFHSLLTLPNVCWVSLQLGDRVADVEHAPTPIFNPTAELTDWQETAALVYHLDLVITVDTAVAHLAGAMGKTTWLLLPFSPDWRWQVTGSVTPWYPSLHLFRQTSYGSWQEVFTELLHRLSAMLENPANIEGNG